MSADGRQAERRAVRRGLLVIAVCAIVLLYCLGAASLWARHRLLDARTATPASTPVATPTAATSPTELLTVPQSTLFA